MCPSGKTAYPSAADAWRVLGRVRSRRRRSHARLTERAAYRCPACGAWHLTHHQLPKDRR